MQARPVIQPLSKSKLLGEAVFLLAHMTAGQLAEIVSVLKRFSACASCPRGVSHHQPPAPPLRLVR